MGLKRASLRLSFKGLTITEYGKPLVWKVVFCELWLWNLGLLNMSNEECLYFFNLFWMRWNPFIHCLNLITICLNQFEPSDRCGRWGRYQLWVATNDFVECSTMILLNKIFTPSNLWKVILPLVGSACQKISVSQKPLTWKVV